MDDKLPDDPEAFYQRYLANCREAGIEPLSRDEMVSKLAQWKLPGGDVGSLH